MKMVCASALPPSVTAVNTISTRRRRRRRRRRTIHWYQIR
jgi:hypothetical protein